MKGYNTNKGFSLIEMIVVVAIMAVLVIVLAPALLQYNERSRAEKDNASMDEVVNAVQLALADPGVYDEVLRFSTVDNISCYVDTNSEANYKKIITKSNPDGVDQYTFTSDARLLDETPFFAAGNMRGVTITFAPNKGSNGSVYDLKQGVVNQYVQVSDNQRVGAMPELYNRIRSVVGDEIFNNSQTYRNSEYTIFIRLGTTGGNDAAKQDSIQAYGQWSGTNLPAAVSYQLVQDRTVGDTGNTITDINDNKWNAENGNKVTINPGDLNGGGSFDFSTDDGNQADEGSIYAYLLNGDTLILRDSPRLDLAGITKEYGQLEDYNSRKWESDKDVIKYVDIETKIYPNTMQQWFYQCSNLKEIRRIENLNTRSVVDMSHTFSYCTSLESLNVSNFDTRNVRTMCCLFEWCTKVPYLDISRWKTSDCTNMNGMFSHCESVSSLNVSSFDTCNVETIGNMFANCWTIEKLKIANFDTSKVNNMDGVFQGCKNLKEIDFGVWESQNANKMCNMFNGCASLTRLDLSNWNTSNVTTMASMFKECKKIKEINIEGWDTHKVAAMNSMFAYCYALQELNVDSLDTENVNTMNSMFCYCTGLKRLDVRHFNTSKVTNMFDLFAYCYEIEEILIGDWDTSNVGVIQGIFHKNHKLKEIDISSFDTQSAVNMSKMFTECRGLTSLDVSNFNIEQVDRMEDMFNGCRNLQTLIGVEDWNVKADATTTTMFSGCQQHIIPSWYKNL